MVAVRHESIWLAQALTATAEFTDASHVPVKMVELNLAGFSGTVDIQGSLDNVNWFNIRYAYVTGDGLLSIVNDQLSFTTETSRRHYMLSEPWPYVRLVMTRTVGTIDARWWGWEGSPFLAPNVTDAWTAVSRTLTAFNAAALGVPTDVWAAATRTLTNPSGVFSDAARTLTAFSADTLFDLTIADTMFGEIQPVSSASANDFGSWVQISANIGTGKRLIGCIFAPDHLQSTAWEVEFGEGALGAEAAVARVGGAMRIGSTAGVIPQIYVPIWKSLTDNARLSARIKDQVASALGCWIVPQVV